MLVLRWVFGSGRVDTAAEVGTGVRECVRDCRARGGFWGGRSTGPVVGLHQVWWDGWAWECCGWLRLQGIRVVGVGWM